MAPPGAAWRPGACGWLHFGHTSLERGARPLCLLPPEPRAAARRRCQRRSRQPWAALAHCLPAAPCCSDNDFTDDEILTAAAMTGRRGSGKGRQQEAAQSVALEAGSGAPILALRLAALLLWVK